MGNTGQAIAMVLCLALAIGSQLYSDEINDLFQIDVKNPENTSPPLIGLQSNESWLVVLVDFESNPLTDNAKQPIQTELQTYSEEYFSQAVGSSVNVEITIHNEIIRAPQPLAAYGSDGPNGRDYGDGTKFLPATLAEYVANTIEQTSLDKFDLNEDGVVDRFLILHSTLAQEQGSGSTNSIW